MQCASFSISLHDLWTLIGSAAAPQIIDMRRRDVYDAAPGLLQRGFMVYDTLFAYLRFASAERHNWPAMAA